jgi:hypothetical protein
LWPSNGTRRIISKLCIMQIGNLSLALL